MIFGTRNVRLLVGWGSIAFALALLVPAAYAGEDDAPPAPNGEVRQPTVVVVEKNGTRTIRLVQAENGEWVRLQDEADEADEADEVDEAPIRFEVVPGPAGSASGSRLRVVRRRRADAGDPSDGAARPSDSPLSTILRWLLEREGPAVDGSPFAAWFERDRVPLPGLRDALKEDGWTAARLERWIAQHFGPREAAATGTGHACPSCGARCHAPGDGDRTASAPPRPWWRPVPPAVSSRTILLWHDGQRWHRQEFPAAPPGMAPPPSGGWGAGPWGPGPRGPAGAGPWGPGPWGGGQGGPGVWIWGPGSGPAPDGSTAPPAPRPHTQGLEALPRSLRRAVEEALRRHGIDPEVLREAGEPGGRAWLRAGPDSPPVPGTSSPPDCPDCPGGAHGHHAPDGR